MKGPRYLEIVKYNTAMTREDFSNNTISLKYIYVSVHIYITQIYIYFPEKEEQQLVPFYNLDEGVDPQNKNIKIYLNYFVQTQVTEEN